MGTETELLWPGAALLLLLGLAAGLCARCSRPGAKKSEKIYEQRSLQENQQSFAVARTYTLVREAWPGTPVGTSSGAESARKDKLLRFSPSLEDPSSPRDPITMDYYNWGQLQKPLEDDDDTNSYENVLICKQNKTESEDEGSEDYQNSASIRQWRESKRVVEPVLREAPPSLAGSPDEDRSELHRLASTVAQQDQSGPIPVF
ncbi:linker for activation of T-cells family member 2 isoform X2 [Camelus ferus]|uniref:Linker for activation of T-cells family member 2 isoform X2 n=1 Tax=Camelus ferus TaxID=419612 RepID=A0A8B8RBQ7_CAMFR|nr:linker for activation of T-cells family member 2 isoform X2 [Camelus dromedarius]XP_032315413.1 linker for activation of T-cells family member 2 isoform X2 [Camelus ferus]